MSDDQRQTLLELTKEEMGAPQLMDRLQRTNRTKFRESVLKPLLTVGFIEMTVPERPNSRLQRYRLTAAGRQRLISSAF